MNFEGYFCVIFSGEKSVKKKKQKIKELESKNETLTNERDDLKNKLEAANKENISAS